MSTLRPKVGISACVLGERVRYNGSAALNDWVVKELEPHVEFIPLCPEMEMGLGVPRPAMRLIRDEAGVKVVTSRDKMDMTQTVEKTVTRLVSQLPNDLDGYILMGRSPLCGAERVKLYDNNNSPMNVGVGRFASALFEAKPTTVVIEAGRLTDPKQRESYVIRLFTMTRFRHCRATPAALQEFHRNHKFLLLAHGRRHLEHLGRLVAGARKASMQTAMDEYKKGLFAALQSPASRATMVDALTHVYGFMKENLGKKERQALLDAIETYRVGHSTRQVPLSLLAFCNKIAGSKYIKDQVILEPYPNIRIGDER